MGHRCHSPPRYHDVRIFNPLRGSRFHQRLASIAFGAVPDGFEEEGAVFEFGERSGAPEFGVLSLRDLAEERIAMVRGRPYRENVGLIDCRVSEVLESIHMYTILGADVSARLPLLVRETQTRQTTVQRYYFWFFGYVAKLPYEREVPFR